MRGPRSGEVGDEAKSVCRIGHPRGSPVVEPATGADDGLKSATPGILQVGRRETVAMAARVEQKKVQVLPVYLVIDVSFSMTGEPLKEAQQAVEQILFEIKLIPSLAE